MVATSVGGVLADTEGSQDLVIIAGAPATTCGVLLTTGVDTEWNLTWNGGWPIDQEYRFTLNVDVTTTPDPAFDPCWLRLENGSFDMDILDENSQVVGTETLLPADALRLEGAGLPGLATFTLDTPTAIEDWNDDMPGQYTVPFVGPGSVDLEQPFGPSNTSISGAEFDWVIVTTNVIQAAPPGDYVSTLEVTFTTTGP
jgi:hypothetical protein